MPKINQEYLQQYANLELIAKKIVEGFITGLHKSPFHGFSVEFAEHRLYNAGESTKNIDWKLYGKTDKLFVKRFEEETNLRCYCVIDNSSSMYFPIQKKLSLENPNKIWFSVYATAALMEMMRKQRDAVGLSFFSDQIELLTDAKSNNTHFHNLFFHLEKLLDPHQIENKRSTMVIDALHVLAENIHKRSMVVVFSDMFQSSGNMDEMFMALQHLKHNKHEVILFHVVDKDKEIDFQYSNRPHHFIDLETGKSLKLNPSEVRGKYAAYMETKTKEIKNRCIAHQIEFVEADINQGFNQILMPYFLKRKKLY